MSVRVGIIGNGWRAVTWRRIIQSLPHQFSLVGTVIRNPDKRGDVADSPVFGSTEELVAAGIEIAVVSVSWSSQPQVIRELAEYGIAVLSETPPAPDVPALHDLRAAIPPNAIVQVAEQYPFHPLSAAQIAMAASGLLGELQTAYVSIAHGYHGVALIRRFLGVGIDDVAVRATRFPVKTTGGPGRNLDYAGPDVESGNQTLATLRFGDKTGVFDFLGSSYFAHIRHRRAVIRGISGEIDHDTVRLVPERRVPIQYPLVRREAGQEGNLEGAGLISITAGDRVWFENPFVAARFSDDEIAMAETLVRTAAMRYGSPAFYGLDEASFDHAVGIAIEQSANSGEEVTISGSDWI